MKYDDAAWHREGDFPPDLPDRAGATHIALFAAWATLGGLASREHTTQCAALLGRLRSRDLDPAAWFAAACDERLTDEDLNAEGNAFARGYYADEAGSNTGTTGYLADYERCFPGLPSLYHVPADWRSYDRLAPVLSRRLRTWRWRGWLLRLLGRRANRGDQSAPVHASDVLDTHRSAFRFWLLLLFVLPLDVLVSLAWFVSPLGLGFAARPPADPFLRACADVAFRASYFVGVPALLLSLPVALALNAARRRRAARIVLLAPLAAFLVLASTFLVLVT